MSYESKSNIKIVYGNETEIGHFEEQDHGLARLNKWIHLNGGTHVFMASSANYQPHLVFPTLCQCEQQAMWVFNYLGAEQALCTLCASQIDKTKETFPMDTFFLVGKSIYQDILCKQAILTLDHGTFCCLKERSHTYRYHLVNNVWEKKRSFFFRKRKVTSFSFRVFNIYNHNLGTGFKIRDIIFH